MTQQILNINDLTPEQRRALLTELTQSEKNEKANKSEQWKQCVNELVLSFFGQAKEISELMTNLKPTIMKEMTEWKTLGAEWFEAKDEDTTGYYFYSLCSRYRIRYEEKEREELDERSVFALNHLEEFLRNRNNNLDEGGFETLVRKLIKSRRSSGGISIRNAKLLISAENDYIEESWEKCIHLLKESLNTNGKYRYITLQFKDDKDEWQTLPMTWTKM